MVQLFRLAHYSTLLSCAPLCSLTHREINWQPKPRSSLRQMTCKTIQLKKFILLIILVMTSSQSGSSKTGSSRSEPWDDGHRRAMARDWKGGWAMSIVCATSSEIELCQRSPLESSRYQSCLAARYSHLKRPRKKVCPPNRLLLCLPISLKYLNGRQTKRAWRLKISSRES